MSQCMLPSSSTIGWEAASNSPGSDGPSGATWDGREAAIVARAAMGAWQPTSTTAPADVRLPETASGKY
eukprot:3865753-Alexandrium_andersonii.AAC.1